MVSISQSRDDDTLCWVPSIQGTWVGGSCVIAGEQPYEKEITLLGALITGGLLLFGGYSIMTADPSSVVVGRGAIGSVLMLATNIGVPFQLVGGVAMLIGAGFVTYPFWAHRMNDPAPAATSHYEFAPKR
jgi:hypothetical protein